MYRNIDKHSTGVMYNIQTSAFRSRPDSQSIVFAPQIMKSFRRRTLYIAVLSHTLDQYKNLENRIPFDPMHASLGRW